MGWGRGVSVQPIHAQNEPPAPPHLSQSAPRPRCYKGPIYVQHAKEPHGLAEGNPGCPRECSRVPAPKAAVVGLRSLWPVKGSVANLCPSYNLQPLYSCCKMTYKSWATSQGKGQSLGIVTCRLAQRRGSGCLCRGDIQRRCSTDGWPQVSSCKMLSQGGTWHHLVLGKENHGSP